MILILLCIFVGYAINLTYIPETKASPSKRLYTFMSYSPADNVLITFGGNDGTNIFNELWGYFIEVNYWSEIIPSIPLVPGKI